MFKHAIACGLGSIAFGAAAGAETPEAEEMSTTTIGEVVVKGQLMKAEDSAFTATVLRNEDIRVRVPGNVDDLFRTVPGMAVRDFQLGSVANAIVIRGFGNGGHGGDLGAVIDGIPLNEAMSHADGYVDLNVVIPLEIDSFTVLKGPVSALYGNYNRGGLVNIQTRKTGDYAELDVSGGSFDTFDLQGSYGTRLGETQQLNLAAQTFRSDGFRPASDTRRSALAGRWSGKVLPELQLALSTRYLKSESDSASYLTQQQFQTDRRGIDPRVDGDGGAKEFLTVRGDANYELNKDLKLLTFAYRTQQDFTRWFTRPISTTTWRQREETYDREVFGAGTSLNGMVSPASVRINYVAGVETFQESTDYGFYDGLNRRVRTAPAQAYRTTELNSVSAFTEIQADVHPLAQLFVGLRADRFTGGCERRGPETGSDPCGDLNDASHVSPKFGVHSQLAQGFTLRASWSEGFALANGFVKYAIGGQPLNENVFRQTEVGAHYALATLDFDVAAYRLTSTGEVRTVSPGIYENFGATLRRGVEANVTWKPVERLDFLATYSVTDTEVTENADARLLDRQIPGVPKDTGSVEATFRAFQGWSLNTAWRYVGQYEVDALNTVEAPSYNLFDVALAYTHKGDHSYRAYLRAENVTDRAYATSVSIIGGGLLFAPGAPRTVRAGVQFDF